MLFLEHLKMQNLQQMVVHNAALHGGSRIFLEGVAFGTRANEASEHWGGLGLRENEIWAFVS